MSGNVDWDRFEHVLESLGVLARLTENKKLSVREGDLDIDNDKKFQFIIRWWNSDDHDTCLENVKQTVNEAIHMARTCLNEITYINNNNNANSANSAFVEKQRSLRRFGRLTESLECASHGIETQKVTYKNDDKFCSRVDVITGNIRDELQDMDITLKLVSVPSGAMAQPQPTSTSSVQQQQPLVQPQPPPTVVQQSAPRREAIVNNVAIVQPSKYQARKYSDSDEDEGINDVF